MHFINLLHYQTNTILDSLPVTIYMAELVCGDSAEAMEQSEEGFYNDDPHSEKVQWSNDRLEIV
jgi:hypothetical protein